MRSAIALIGLVISMCQAYWVPPSSFGSSRFQKWTMPQLQMASSPPSKDDDGVFLLPGSDGPVESGGSDDEIRKATPDDKRRVQAQLLRAFDNLQDFEVRDMAQLIFLGSTAEHLACQRNLLRITRQCEELQAAAANPERLPLGQIEYMEDMYRSLLSELRMYGKDADFFLPNGSIVEASQRGFLAKLKWPWSK